MSFSFPAYHTESMNVMPLTSAQLNTVILNSIISLGWSVQAETENYITAKINMGWASWGERLKVEIIDEERIVMTSKCVFPTQCFDWGKNKKNINELKFRVRMFLKDESSSNN